MKIALFGYGKMGKEIEQIAQRYLNNPERLEVGSVNTAAPLVKQDTYNVKESDKYDVDGDLIYSDKDSGTLWCKEKHIEEHRVQTFNDAFTLCRVLIKIIKIVSQHMM